MFLNERAIGAPRFRQPPAIYCTDAVDRVRGLYRGPRGRRARRSIRRPFGYKLRVQLTRLDEAIRIYDTEADALAEVDGA